MTRAQQSPDWMLRGLCRQTDPDAFFPDKGERAEDAKAVCHRCPVQAECLQYALDHDERYGVWGGMTQRQLDLLRATRQRYCIRCLTAPVEHPFRYCDPCRSIDKREKHARYKGRVA